MSKVWGLDKARKNLSRATEEKHEKTPEEQKTKDKTTAEVHQLIEMLKKKDEKLILKDKLLNISKVNGKYKEWRFWLDYEESDMISELQARLMESNDERNAFFNWPTSSVLQLLSNMINQCLPGEDASKSCSIELILFSYVASFKRDLDDDEMKWVSDTAKEILENKEPDIDEIIVEMESKFLNDGSALRGDFNSFNLFR